MVPAETAWSVTQPTWLAILDERFSRAMAPYPEVVSALCGRLTRRTRGLVERLAIVQERRVSSRLYLVLWQLADRFGVMSREGVVLPVPLSHSLLADMVAAGRSPVTHALSELERFGLVRRRPDRSWCLGGAPPVDPTAFVRAGRAVPRS
jgi:CRP/FNR family transcriptional regulator, cyclic AMP receptor protein